MKKKIDLSKVKYTLSTYNVDRVIESIIMEIKQSYTGIPNVQIAKLMGISERTLYRYMIGMNKNEALMYEIVENGKE